MVRDTLSLAKKVLTMLFQFPPMIEAGIAAGQYLQVFSSTGVPLSIARDTTTGQFVGNAIGLLDQSGLPFNPIAVPLDLATSGLRMYQMHKGFQSVLTNISILQSTTSVIGMGVATGVALSAVNLYQTIKLRKAVERLEIKVENGFIDLKQALKNQGSEIIQHIDQVAKDIKFEQHRLILVRAYGLFTQAINRLNSAIKIQDISRKNTEIDLARSMLFESLADYRNPQLFEETCASGSLRRLECSWLIEQMIVGTYQVQNELVAASDRLVNLQQQLREDSVNVITSCDSEEELDFLFPEINRLHDQDLIVLASWQNNLDWMQSLPPSELKLLASSDCNQSQTVVNSNKKQFNDIIQQSELELYEILKQKSHFSSLRDQLVFMMKPELREDYENYISEEAKKYDHKVFIPSNLKQISNFTLSNLFWYFYIRDESQNQEEQDEPEQINDGQYNAHIKCPSCNKLNYVKGDETDYKCKFCGTNINVYARKNDLIFDISNQEENQIFLKVKNIIAEQLGIEPKQIKQNYHFIHDLRIDPLDAVELVMALEEEFNIEISDEDAEKIQTVQQAVSYLSKKINK